MPSSDVFCPLFHDVGFFESWTSLKSTSPAPFLGLFAPPFWLPTGSGDVWLQAGKFSRKLPVFKNLDIQCPSFVPSSPGPPHWPFLLKICPMSVLNSSALVGANYFARLLASSHSSPDKRPFPLHCSQKFSNPLPLPTPTWCAIPPTA